MKLLVHLFAIALLCFITSTCKNGVPDPELAATDLLRGDILFCGSGDFGDVPFSRPSSYKTRETFDLGIALLHSFEYEEAEKAIEYYEKLLELKKLPIATALRLRKQMRI